MKIIYISLLLPDYAEITQYYHYVWSPTSSDFKITVSNAWRDIFIMIKSANLFTLLISDFIYYDTGHVSARTFRYFRLSSFGQPSRSLILLQYCAAFELSDTDWDWARHRQIWITTGVICICPIINDGASNLAHIDAIVPAVFIEAAFNAYLFVSI